MNVAIKTNGKPFAVNFQMSLEQVFDRQSPFFQVGNMGDLGIEGEHLAPFPKQIITLPILQTSTMGDLVLDPFCGSGNVGRVCDVLDRNFVGYDLSNYLS